MAKEQKGELVVAETDFDYSPLPTKVAEQVQSAAERIRQSIKRTIEHVIQVGNELLAVKDALPHGEFGPWLRAEFGWTERTARNFMGVAGRFGPKTEIISVLRIDPTAAYLLAAPSAPDEARETAIERAENGEHITTAVAKDIIKKERAKRTRNGKALPTEKLGLRLSKVLEQFRKRWKPAEVSIFARQLREYAGLLEDGRKKSGKKS